MLNVFGFVSSMKVSYFRVLGSQTLMLRSSYHAVCIIKKEKRKPLTYLVAGIDIFHHDLASI